MAEGGMTRERLNDLARTIIDSNRYMALGTRRPRTDTHGWFASEDYKHFHWVSSSEARHSANVAARPEAPASTAASRLRRPRHHAEPGRRPCRR